MFLLISQSVLNLKLKEQQRSKQHIRRLYLEKTLVVLKSWIIELELTTPSYYWSVLSEMSDKSNQGSSNNNGGACGGADAEKAKQQEEMRQREAALAVKRAAIIKKKIGKYGMVYYHGFPEWSVSQKIKRKMIDYDF